MAYDKVVDSVKLESDLKIVGDAIREKAGISGPLGFPQGMAEAVRTIKTGGGGGACDYTREDGLLSGKMTSYTNDTATELNIGVFNRNKKLETIDLNAVTSISGDYIFEQCSVSQLNVPQLQRVQGYQIFAKMPNIKKLTFPALNSGRVGYDDCPVLTTIDLGTQNTQNNDSMIINCAGEPLSMLILRWENKLCSLGGVGDLKNTPIASGTGYIYVPKTLVEQYKSATNWITYAAQIRAIEDYPEITGGAK